MCIEVKMTWRSCVYYFGEDGPANLSITEKYLERWIYQGPIKLRVEFFFARLPANSIKLFALKK